LEIQWKDRSGGHLPPPVAIWGLNKLATPTNSPNNRLRPAPKFILWKSQQLSPPPIISTRKTPITLVQPIKYIHLISNNPFQKCIKFCCLLQRPPSHHKKAYINDHQQYSPARQREKCAGILTTTSFVYVWQLNLHNWLDSPTLCPSDVREFQHVGKVGHGAKSDTSTDTSRTSGVHTVVPSGGPSDGQGDGHSDGRSGKVFSVRRTVRRTVPPCEQRIRDQKEYSSLPSWVRQRVSDLSRMMTAMYTSFRYLHCNDGPLGLM